MLGPNRVSSSLLLFWGNTLAHWQTAFQMFRWHLLINLNKFSKKVTENSQNISVQYWVQSESACHCCCHFSETHTLSWISINHILLWVIFERTSNIYLKDHDKCCMLRAEATFSVFDKSAKAFNSQPSNNSITVWQENCCLPCKSSIQSMR